MAKHWQNVLHGADHAMDCAHRANENRKYSRTITKYFGHTCEEWTAIAIRRYARAAAMHEKQTLTKGQHESHLSSAL